MEILTETEFASLAPLRLKYLESLPEIQEIYLEFLNHEARYYWIQSLAETIGYVIVSHEQVLLEFYLTDQYVPQSNEIFSQIINRLNIRSIYCKSFDYLLMSYCFEQRFSYQLVGKMYRDRISELEFPPDGLTFRLATLSDLPYLMTREDECFEPRSELKGMIQSHSIYMCYFQSQLVGCGFLTRVYEQSHAFDVGVWVDERFRRQGVATRIISHLMSLCRQSGGVPVLGCAIDNFLSQKTIEKNGFISKHRLLEFLVH